MIDFAIAGALGGLAKSLFEQKGKITLPQYELASDGTKYVHLGFVFNVILGAIVSYYSSSDAVGAFTTGISASFITEKFFEITVKKQ